MSLLSDDHFSSGCYHFFLGRWLVVHWYHADYNSCHRAMNFVTAVQWEARVGSYDVAAGQCRVEYRAEKTAHYLGYALPVSCCDVLAVVTVI